jgi:hypothetical protein
MENVEICGFLKQNSAFLYEKLYSESFIKSNCCKLAGTVVHLNMSKIKNKYFKENARLDCKKSYSFV